VTSLAITASPTRGDRQAPDCGVVIVTYNSAGEIPELLHSLRVAGNELTNHVVVVDNASQDESVAVARALGATCIELGANRGYAAAINVGRRYVRGCRALLILNPDTRLEPSSLRRLLAALADPSVGVAVPRLVDSHGATLRSLRREPSVARAFGDALLGDHWRGRPSWFSEVVWDREIYERSRDVDWATGAALAVSQDCNELLGPWNEEFFLYSEEVEFAARVRAAGLRIRYVPDAVVTHREGGSGRSDQLVALTAVNRVRYYRARHGRAPAAAFTAAVLLSEALRSAHSAHRASLRAVLRREAASELLQLGSRHA
jgi:GT2 family glycosyltransferase